MKDFTEQYKLLKDNKNDKAINENDIHMVVDMAYKYVKKTTDNHDAYYNDFFGKVSEIVNVSEPDTLAAVGLCFEYGLGIICNLRMSKALYDYAAEKKSMLAYLRLAEMYENGKGVKSDGGMSSRYYELAAYMGDPESSFTMAERYRNGVWVEKNPKEMFSLYEKAANAGIAEAMLRLAQCFEYGEGTNVDNEAAISWYKKAAENGIEEGVIKYAENLYNKGCRNEALKWYEIAADNGNKSAMERLVDCYVDVDFGKAVSIAGNLYAFGYTRQLRKLIINYLDATFDKAQLLLKPCKMLANAGDTEVQICLADYYRAIGHKGHARDWYRVAANSGSQHAMYMMYEIYDEIGEKEHSQKWLKRAYRHGSEEAQKKMIEEADKNNASKDSSESKTNTIENVHSDEASDEQAEVGMDKILYAIYEDVMELKSAMKQGLGSTSELITQECGNVMKAVREEAQITRESVTNEGSIILNAVHEEGEAVRESVDEAAKRMEKAILYSEEAVISVMNGKIGKYISDVQGMIGYMRTQRDISDEEFDEVSDRYCVYINERMNKLLLPTFEGEAAMAVQETEKYLSDCFSKAWHRINGDTKKQLVSASILWDSCRNLTDFDFSGVCVAVCAALECELRHVFFAGYQNYMIKNYDMPPNNEKAFEKWPEILLSTSKYMYKKNLTAFERGVLKEKPVVELKQMQGFSFGTLMYLLGVRVGRHTVPTQSELLRQSFDGYLSTLHSNVNAKVIIESSFFQKYMCIYEKRNPIAHGEGASCVTANMLYRQVFGMSGEESVFNELFDLI